MAKFTMTQKEAQLVVDGIVQWEELSLIDSGRYASPKKKCPLCRGKGCGVCPVKRYNGRGCGHTPWVGGTPKQIIKYAHKMLADAGYEIVEIEVEE